MIFVLEFLETASLPIGPLLSSVLPSAADEQWESSSVFSLLTVLLWAAHITFSPQYSMKDESFRKNLQQEQFKHVNVPTRVAVELAGWLACSGA